MTVRADRRPGRPPRVTVVTALLGLLVLIGAGARPVGAAGAQDGVGDLRLLDQTTVLEPEDELTLELGVPRDAPADATLTFELFGAVTAPDRGGRRTFEATLEGERLGSVVNRIPDVPVSSLPTVGAGAVEARFAVVPGGEVPLVGFRISDPGVFPLRVTLAAADGTEIDQLVTYLIRLPVATSAGATPLRVAVVVPIGAPLALQPDGTWELGDADLGRLAALADVVAGNAEVPVTLVVQPETLDAMAAGEGGEDVLATLRGGQQGRRVLSGPYVPLDLASWGPDELRAELTEQLPTGADVVDTRLDPAPPAGWQTWLAGPALDDGSVGVLRGAGVTQLILDPDRLDGDADRYAPFDLDTTGDGVRAVAADQRLASRLGSTGDPALDGQIAVAEAATVWFEAPTEARGLAVVLRGDAGDAPAFDEFLGRLAILSSVTSTTAPTEATTTDGLFALPAAAAERLLPLAEEAPPIGDFPADQAAARSRVGSARTMVPTDPGLLDGTERLVDSAAAAGLDAPSRDDYLAAADGAIDTMVGGIHIRGEADGITLTTDQAQIPVTIENALTYPVTAQLRLASQKLDFPDGDTRVVELGPGPNRVEVPVRTKASGVFQLEISLRSPDEQLEVGTTSVAIRSTAISGLGLWLSVGAGAFLLLWWARHWRASRSRRLVTPDEEVGSPSSVGPPPVRPPADTDTTETRVP